MTVFIDTSALLAILDEDDHHHSEAANTFRALLATVELVTHNYVEVECLALVRRRLGRGAVAQLMDDILPALTTIWIDEGLHRAALAAHRAGGSSLSLVDHVSFEVMRREGIETAFAFDRDFEAQGFGRPAVQGRVGEEGRVREVPAPYLPGTRMASDLVSVAEIATRAARPVNTIQSWRRRNGDFPEPLVSLAAGPVWRWPVVEAWIQARQPPRRVPSAS